MLLLGTILAGVAWRFAATHHHSMTTIEVLKLKPSTSVPAFVRQIILYLIILYKVQFPGGRNYIFADTEPFGSLNEVFIDSVGKNWTEVCRMRNDP